MINSQLQNVLCGFPTMIGTLMWVQQIILLKRMGWVKRRASSKAKVMVENFEEIKEDFLLDVRNIVLMDEIPGELIINWDQTGVNYIPVASWTMLLQRRHSH